MSFGPAAAARLSEKTVLITGASSGIGKATAREFADSSNGNIKLILTARRIEKLETLKKELEKKYPSIQIFNQLLDISDIKSVEPFFAALPLNFQDIDILVNNAGIALGYEYVGDIEPADIDKVYSTNVIGNIAIVQHVVSHFRTKNAGDVVQIGSIAGRDPYVGGSIYCSSKAALNAFTSSLRKELIPTKIRVIEIQPGAVNTEFHTVRLRGDEEKAKKICVSEPLYPEDIAESVVYAVSRRQNVVVAEALMLPSGQAGSGSLYWRDPKWNKD